jgi:CRP/FNR family transcriptional regulator
MADTPHWQDLKKIPLFADLTENEIYQVMKLSFEKKYTKDSTLFIEGMAGEVLYIIKSGKVDIIKKTDKGEVLLSSWGPASFARCR